MNVLEMHIAVKQGIDRIHSQRDDQIRTEELDLELNRAMQRFINQRYGKNNAYQEGFEESQKRIDELRSLLVEYSAPVSFKEELISGKIWVDSFEFPSDYMYLINQKSRIFLNNCREMPYNDVAMPNTYYFTFRLEDFLVDNNEFLAYIALIGPTQAAIAWQPSQELLASGYDPAQFPQSTNAVVNDMFNNPGLGFEFHWQSYGTLEFPGQFIVTVDVETHPWFQWDASNNQVITPLVAYNSTNTQVNAIFPLVQDRSSEIRRVPNINEYQVEDVLNRFSQQDDIYRLLDDPFNTTYKREPLTTIRDNFIDVYTSSIFIIDEVKITYIRKPIAISLTLGYDCELPDHTHQEIVDMAVASILERTSDPRYKTQMGELINRE